MVQHSPDKLKIVNWLYPPLNPRVQNIYYYSNDANSGYNALVTQIEHRFSSVFDFDAQYTYAMTIDEGSNDYFIGNYPYSVADAKGPADYNSTDTFSVWGVWSPKYFKGTSLMDKLHGGWHISGTLTAHSGFPWTPNYGNFGCNIIYQNSGYCALRPAAYLGGAGISYSNSTFMQANGNSPSGKLPAKRVRTASRGSALTS